MLGEFLKMTMFKPLINKINKSNKKSINNGNVDTKEDTNKSNLEKGNNSNQGTAKAIALISFVLTVIYYLSSVLKNFSNVYDCTLLISLKLTVIFQIIIIIAATMSVCYLLKLFFTYNNLNLISGEIFKWITVLAIFSLIFIKLILVANLFNVYVKDDIYFKKMQSEYNAQLAKWNAEDQYNPPNGIDWSKAGIDEAKLKQKNASQVIKDREDRYEWVQKFERKYKMWSLERNTENWKYYMLGYYVLYIIASSLTFIASSWFITNCTNNYIFHYKHILKLQLDKLKMYTKDDWYYITTKIKFKNRNTLIKHTIKLDNLNIGSKKHASSYIEIKDSNEESETHLYKRWLCIYLLGMILIISIAVFVFGYYFQEGAIESMTLNYSLTK